MPSFPWLRQWWIPSHPAQPSLPSQWVQRPWPCRVRSDAWTEQNVEPPWSTQWTSVGKVKESSNGAVYSDESECLGPCLMNQPWLLFRDNIPGNSRTPSPCEYCPGMSNSPSDTPVITPWVSLQADTDAKICSRSLYCVYCQTSYLDSSYTNQEDSGSTFHTEIWAQEWSVQSRKTDVLWPMDQRSTPILISSLPCRQFTMLDSNPTQSYPCHCQPW